MPFWGGPTGIDTDGTAAGDRVYTYGNSSLRAGIEQLSPHTGISLGDDAADGGWSHPLYTVTPGVPGDSGSRFLSADGKAIGTLSTLGLAPLPLSNNIGDLGKELAYAQQPPASPVSAGQRHGAVRPDPLTRGPQSSARDRVRARCQRVPTGSGCCHARADDGGTRRAVVAVLAVAGVAARRGPRS